MSLLSVETLTLRIGAKEVLHGVSLGLDPGEILALTGESGSGKSMTAFSVMGLLPQGAVPAGAIRLDGTDLLRLSEREMCRFRGQAMGMVFQEPMTALNPVQRIGDQVAETLRVHGTPRAEAEARAAETLARVGLDPERIPPSRYPHELSGGQRQRVGIAMAVALRPRLLIADEPTTALDVTTQARILDLLKRLVREDGMGLLLITHDLAVVHGIADRLAVMQGGRIVETGPTAGVFAEMRHPYTRQLFAASAHRAELGPRVTHGPLLEARGVVRDYPLPRPHPFAKRDSHRAVKGVDLDIRRGERVGLVGESGCGKSTLTRALLGLEPPTAGTITLGGAPVRAGAKDRHLRRRMQAVFQDPYGSFDPRHSVGRLVAEPLHLADNIPDREARVSEVLEAVGLSPDDAAKSIHAFSGGQRQRIAIARALVTRPDLVVFDEAVSALDVRVRAGILDLIARLSREEGLAYLFISHDLSVVRGICDRVMVMKAGEIVEDRVAEDLFAAPEHPYTRELLAAAPVLPEREREAS
ncbi:microcin C ABC transporter ATP-binding protein YejF [Roseivivax halodurans JCM 10272]|uniref:Microcin C ABC transporter ATP-binding protein YejF n=1 Tax=Roseivivax halodurans JCM 10272 TaxID=1449350 RepID=X7EFL6_9RHOB|nr:ABC transporter ATP-binding protein [Roseivivax halodurans]ETX14869.1 microcin C ABC transporter ATP-binding protein YejF [Roseivivax halodurans JCM 10272]